MLSDTMVQRSISSTNHYAFPMPGTDFQIPHKPRGLHFTQLTKLLKEGGRKTTQGGAINGRRTVKHCYLGEAPWPFPVSLGFGLLHVEPLCPLLLHKQNRRALSIVPKPGNTGSSPPMCLLSREAHISDFILFP